VLINRHAERAALDRLLQVVRGGGTQTLAELADQAFALVAPAPALTTDAS
jgi:hypothetical protein